MTDLGHGKDVIFTKTVDPSSPIEYSGTATVSTDNQLATVKFVNDHPGAAAALHENLTISTPGQTSFTLSSAPVNPDRSILPLNGQVRKYGGGDDYTISGTTLTWNDPGGLSLLTTDDLQIWYNVSIGGGFLSQKQIYHFGDAGNDGNDGKSIESPFLTITAAIAAATAQTPSSSNQFTLYGIGAIEITPDFTLPQYVHLHAPDAILTANVAANDGNVITVKDSLQPTSGSPPRNFSKTSGTGTATANILGLFDCGIGRGMNCTSGTLIVNTMNAHHGNGGYLMGDGAGTSILRSHGLITNTGGGYVVFAFNGGNYDLHYTRIKSTSSNAVFGSGSSAGVLKAMGGWIDATGGGRLYQFGTAGQFTLMGTGYDETNASTNIGASTLIFNIARDPNDKTQITNSISTVNINGTEF